MAAISQVYNGTMSELLLGNYKDNLVSAILLSSAYAFDSTHSTFADCIAHQVGNPIEVTNRTITFTPTDTRLRCNDLDFTPQGVLNARYVVFVFGAGLETDKLLFLADIDNTAQDQEINGLIKIDTDGLIRIPKA